LFVKEKICMGQNNSLVGKVAVITGGGSGIGYGCAAYLKDHGAQVAIIDLDEAAGENAQKKLGSEAIFVGGNVSINADCQSAIKEVVNRFGHIDILVNGAGVIRRKSVVELTESEWDLVIDVSLKGTYLMSKYAIPVMQKQGGSIINIGSGWGLKGGPKAAAYCAAKGGVVNLTRAMAIDHGPQNIKVNCVCPGDVDTPLLRSEAKQLGEDEQKFMSDAADRPLARVGSPLDVAKAVYFLASDLSSWVTGAVIVVDGGGLA
jgi:NAD(P)-dependent dehydrogenase (short-subunit alcohol dehydrogenase family)